MIYYICNLIKGMVNISGLKLSESPSWKGEKIVSSHGYVKIKMPEHPFSDANGWVYEHRIVMERKIGRYLLPEEIVHHKNEIKTDNSPDNLALAANIAEHKFFHRESSSNKRKPNESNTLVSCACGCGAKFLKYDSGNRPRKYLFGGHAKRGKLSYDPNETILCACGCGTLLKRFDSSVRERKYISGHYSRNKAIITRGNNHV